MDQTTPHEASASQAIRRPLPEPHCNAALHYRTALPHPGNAPPHSAAVLISGGARRHWSGMPRCNGGLWHQGPALVAVLRFTTAPRCRYSSLQCSI